MADETVDTSYVENETRHYSLASRIATEVGGEVRLAPDHVYVHCGCVEIESIPRGEGHLIPSHGLRVRVNGIRVYVRGGSFRFNVGSLPELSLDFVPHEGMPNTPGAQTEMERLREENTVLRRAVDDLQKESSAYEMGVLEGIKRKDTLT